MCYYQQRCVYIISKPKPPYHFQTYIRNAYSRNISHHFPYWRRYTFLSHLTKKSKISVRWIKKLVAATDGVYASIQFYKLATASVARRFRESSRPFLCFLNMCYYQQRCANKISKPKPYIIYKFIHQCVFSKSYHIFLPFCGYTPFYLISQRNRRFLLDG